MKKHIKHLTTFWRNINNVLRSILVGDFIIIFNNHVQKMSFNSGEKWPRKWYRLFCLKIHNGEKVSEVLYFYVNDANITQKHVIGI